MRKLLGLTIVGLVLLILLPRIFDLDTWRGPDEDRIISYTTGFAADLTSARWRDLLQYPHGAMTTYWLGATTVYQPSWVIKKLPLVLGQGLLIAAIGYVAVRLWGKQMGILVVTLLALNPLLIAHTRIYAMDALLAHFLALSLLFLLLWEKTNERRYLLAASFAAAASFLSKLPGLFIVPATAAIFAWWIYQHEAKRRALITGGGVWLLGFLVSLCIILPSFAFAPFAVIGTMAEYFRSGEFDQHAAKAGYYIETLFFFSTPLQLLALIMAPLLWLYPIQYHDEFGEKNRVTRRGSPVEPPQSATRRMKRSDGGAGAAEPFFSPNSRRWLIPRQHILFFLLAAVLFTVQMSLADKKGDRYILPSFVLWDIAAAGIVINVGSTRFKKIPALLPYTLFSVLLAWQMYDIARLHPYTLSYVNPLTKSWYGQRHHGWGEGLDLAANYLNSRPNAANLTVAAYYPTEFSHYFRGHTIPAHQHDHENADYVVLYRGMYDRGSEAWETDVLKHYQAAQAEKVIRLNGLDYAWIYSTHTLDHEQQRN